MPDIEKKPDLKAEQVDIKKQTNERLTKIQKTLEKPEEADKLTSLVDKNFKEGLKTADKWKIKSIVTKINEINDDTAKQLDTRDTSSLNALSKILSPYTNTAEEITFDKSEATWYNKSNEAINSINKIQKEISEGLYNDLPWIDNIKMALDNPSKENVQKLQTHLLKNMKWGVQLKFYQSSRKGAKNATQVPEEITTQPDGWFWPGTMNALRNYLDTSSMNQWISEITANNLIRNNQKPVEVSVAAKKELKGISIAQPKQLEKPTENIKSFSDIAENLDPSLKDNQEVSKILRKIKRLEKRLDNDDSGEELKEKQKELTDIENKIIDKKNEIQKQDTYINEVLSKNPNLSFLIPENQEKLTDLKKENSELTAQKIEIEEDIKDIESENKKENNKDQTNIQKITEQVTKLQNHLSNNKKDLNNQREGFRNNISDLQKMIVWEDVLNNIPEERAKDRSKIIENNNKIEPQLENLKKQFDTITAKIDKIDSFIGKEWQLNSYLAQYTPKGSTEQPANENTEPKIQDIPVAEAKEIKKEVIPATKSTEVTKPIYDSTKVTEVTKPIDDSTKVTVAKENWLTRSFIKKTSDKKLENKNIKEALENGLKNKWYEITYNDYWDIIFSMETEPTKDSISASSKDMSTAKNKANFELIGQVKQLTGNSNIVEQFKNHVSLGKWKMYRDNKNDQYTYVVNSWRINKFLLDKLNKTA